MKKYLSILSVAFVALLTLTITPACQEKEAPKNEQKGQGKDYLDGKTFELIEDIDGGNEYAAQKLRLRIQFNHPNYTSESAMLFVSNINGKEDTRIMMSSTLYGTYNYKQGRVTFEPSSGEKRVLTVREALTDDDIEQEKKKTSVVTINEQTGTLTITFENNGKEDTKVFRVKA